MNTIINCIRIRGEPKTLETIAARLKASSQLHHGYEYFHIGDAFFPIPEEAGQEEKDFWCREYQSNLIVDDLTVELEHSVLERSGSRTEPSSAQAALRIRCETNSINMTTFLQRLSAMFKLHINFESYDLDYHIHDYATTLIDGKIAEVKQTLEPSFLASTDDYELELGRLLPVYAPAEPDGLEKPEATRQQMDYEDDDDSPL